MAAVAPLIEYHRRDLLHSRGVVPFERHLVTQSQAPPPLVVADQRALATLFALPWRCLLYTSPSPRDRTRSRMPSSA